MYHKTLVELYMRGAILAVDRTTTVSTHHPATSSNSPNGISNYLSLEILSTKQFWGYPWIGQQPREGGLSTPLVASCLTKSLGVKSSSIWKDCWSVTIEKQEAVAPGGPKCPWKTCKTARNKLQNMESTVLEKRWGWVTTMSEGVKKRSSVWVLEVVATLQKSSKSVPPVASSVIGAHIRAHVGWKWDVQYGYARLLRPYGGFRDPLLYDESWRGLRAKSQSETNESETPAYFEEKRMLFSKRFCRKETK